MRPTMLTVLTVLTFVAVPAAAWGQAKSKLDAGEAQPYRWHVAVRWPSGSPLTATVRESIRRQLRASLQAALESAGTVEVIDLATLAERGQPTIRAFEDRGWAALDPEPNRELTDYKLHILTIDYREGQYHLAARQLDGPSGLASPVVRQHATRSPDMLARIAGLLIEPDFGPVGTLELVPDHPEKARVVFQASRLAPPERWVRPGDVLAVSVIRELARPLDPATRPKDFVGQLPLMRTGVPYAYTLLKVQSRVGSGEYECQVLTRFKDPFGRDALNRDARRRLGLRAMKLTTIEAKVQLRLVGQDGLPHQRSSLLQVAGTDQDFNTIPGPDDLFKLEGGIYRSSRVFTNIACIQVGLEGGRTELFPVPVLGSEPFTLKFEVKAADEERALFARDCNRWRGRIAELAATQEALFRGVNKLLDLSRNREALQQAEGGSSRIADERMARGEEFKQLKEHPLAKDEALQKLLEAGEKQLAAIDDGQARMAKTLALLREAAAKANDPERLEVTFRAQELSERIKALIATGEIPDALEAYEKLINLLPDRQDLKDAREKLLAEWTPKDESHRQARETLKQLMACRTLDDFETRLPPARKAVEVSIAKGDRLGLARLVNNFESLYLKLNKMLDATDASTEDGAKALQAIEAVTTKLRELERLAREEAKRLADKSPAS